MATVLGATFFFSDGKYVTYSRFPAGIDKPSVGDTVKAFDLPDGFWNPSSSLCAALNDDRPDRYVTYFFCGPKYVTFNWLTRKREGDARDLSEWNLPSEFKGGVSAASNSRDPTPAYQNVAWFFNGSLWVAYSWRENKAVSFDSDKPLVRRDLTSAWDLPPSFRNPRGGVNSDEPHVGFKPSYVKDEAVKADPTTRKAYFNQGRMFVRYAWSAGRCDRFYRGITKEQWGDGARADAMNFLPKSPRDYTQTGSVAAMEGSLLNKIERVSAKPRSTVTVETDDGVMGDFESMVIGLELFCNQVRFLLAEIDKIMRRRMTCVSAAHAIERIATVMTWQSRPLPANVDADVRELARVTREAYDNIRLTDIRKVVTPAFAQGNSWAVIVPFDNLGDNLVRVGTLIKDYLTNPESQYQKLRLKFLRRVKDRNLLDVPKVKNLIKRDIDAQRDGTEQMGEALGDPDLGERLVEMARKARENGALDENALDVSSCALESSLSLLGTSNTMAGQIYGNLAGPPSLTVVMTYIGGAMAMTKLVNAAKAGDAAKAKKLFDVLGRAIAETLSGDLRGKFLGALRSEDPRKIMELRPAVAKHWMDNVQTGLKAKGVAAAFAILSAALTIYNAIQKKEPLNVFDMTGVFVAAVQGANAITEVIATMANLLERSASSANALRAVGCGVGVVACVLGIVTGTYTLFFDPKADAIDKWVAGLSIAGNSFLLVGILAGTSLGAAVFGTRAAAVTATVFPIGFVLLLASGGVALYKVWTDPNFRLNGVNRTVKGLLKTIEENELFVTLKANDANASAMHARLDKYFGDYENNNLRDLTKWSKHYTDIRQTGVGESALAALFGSGPFVDPLAAGLSP